MIADHGAEQLLPFELLHITHTWPTAQANTSALVAQKDAD